MKFFTHCTTLEQVKATYKQLALQHHPDRGGDTATMQAINSEYAYASACILKGAGLSAEATEREIRFSEEYRNVIQQLIHLPGIVIELVGNWIWVTGDTRLVREQLKAAWYYRSELFRVLRGGKKSLGQIRAKYGSHVIGGNPYDTIQSA